MCSKRAAGSSPGKNGSGRGLYSLPFTFTFSASSFLGRAPILSRAHRIHRSRRLLSISLDKWFKKPKKPKQKPAEKPRQKKPERKKDHQARKSAQQSAEPKRSRRATKPSKQVGVGKTPRSEPGAVQAPQKGPTGRPKPSRLTHATVPPPSPAEKESRRGTSQEVSLITQDHLKESARLKAPKKPKTGRPRLTKFLVKCKNRKCKFERKVVNRTGTLPAKYKRCKKCGGPVAVKKTS